MFDNKKMQKSVKLFLEATGHKKDEHTKETPKRAADMWEILLGGNFIDPSKYIKLFPAESSSPVMVCNQTFHSFCAHHTLPFYGKFSVMYLPNKNLIGLSKLGRIFRSFTKRLQVQERLTRDFADFLFNSELKPRGVAVIVDAQHMCMSMRGVRNHGSYTRTFEIKGVLHEKQFELFERTHNTNPSNGLFGY